MSVPVLTILGAGIAGISACYHALKEGVSAVAYEAKAEPGGLLNYFEIEGFRFDNAVHLSFTQDDYVRSIFDKTPYYTHSPEAHCYEKGIWLKHPVQNNLHPLALKDKVELIESFIKRPDAEPKNYEEWLISQYGKKIAERYPLRYTQKYWGTEAKNLSLNWVGNRMRRAKLSEVLAGALEERNENHYYASEMRYPKKGGYKAFIQPLIRDANIVCNKKIIEIDAVSKLIIFSDNTSVKYNNLINTLPITLLTRLIKNTPKKVRDASKKLQYTTVDLVSVGFSRPDIPPYLWFYLYDAEMIPARGYSPSIKSPDNVPEGCSSLQFEIYNHNTNAKLDSNDLIKNVRDSILSLGVCKESDIRFLHHKYLPYGNVVFYEGMESDRQVVLDYLANNGIVSCGRFGEWDYLWSDQSLLSGKKAIDEYIEREF